ncbi:MAG: hypothetical protein LQ351_004132 [Letrouitia transgressa]|nr:MAG: hypothetical protein LQ351_004132 [Letrouitia transgressa]
MLLANLSKSDSMARLLTLTRKPVPSLSTSPNALTQLLNLYSKGAKARYNPHASFDHLAYLIAELSKFPSTATFLTSSSHPLAQHLAPFTTPSTSYERRLGTASTIRNTLLAIPSPTTTIPAFLPSILPSLLSPLIGPDPPFSEQETELLPPELQYLGADQKREEDVGILGLLLDALFLCAVRGGEEGRKAVKGMGAYAVVRECHAGVEDEEVQEKAERIVQVLMREEAEVDAPPEGDAKIEKGAVIGEVEPEDEEGVVDVF